MSTNNLKDLKVSAAEALLAAIAEMAPHVKAASVLRDLAEAYERVTVNAPKSPAPGPSFA